MIDLNRNEAKKNQKKKFNMADSKKLSFSKAPILVFLVFFRGLVIGLVKLIDVKGIDVAQRIWL